MLASTGDGGGRNTRQRFIIFELVSLVFSLIISWTFRNLAHEEDQNTIFLSIALKQTKGGPRSSGTPFLVINIFWKNVQLIKDNVKLNLIILADLN